MVSENIAMTTRTTPIIRIAFSLWEMGSDLSLKFDERNRYIAELKERGLSMKA